MYWEVYESNRIPEEIFQSLQKTNGKFNLAERLIYFIKEGKYKEYYLAGIIENKKVLGIIIHTPPFPIQIVILNNEIQLIDFISEKLSSYSNIQMGIAGDKDFTIKLAEKLYSNWYVAVHEGVYVCHKVINKFDGVKGHSRITKNEDIILLKKWYESFMIETGLVTELKNLNRDEGNNIILNWIDNEAGQLFINKNKPVSFVKYSGVGKIFAHVAMVYTPHEYRGNGYAAKNVSLLTECLLKDYKYTTLYTNLENPTSNKIYKQIGYEQVGEFVKILLKNEIMS